MLSQEMMYYINMALGDGELEAAEFEFLKKKAVELGEDPVEVEMTVKTLAAQAKQQAALEKNRCPNCGAQLEQMTGICEHCGFALDSSENAEQLFSHEEFSRKIEELAAESSYEKRFSGLSRIISPIMLTVKILLLLTFVFLFVSAAVDHSKFRKIRKGTLTWYPKITSHGGDSPATITIEAETAEQKTRAETDGEYAGRIRWDNMTAQEKDDYKQQRTKEIINNPWAGVDMEILFLMLLVAGLLSFAPSPRKSVRQRKLEEAVLSYPIPVQRKLIFDLCVQLSSRIEPVNTFLRFFSKREKIKAQQNAFLTKKIMQIYGKAKLIFKNEPQILQQLKELLAVRSISV